MKYLNFIGGKWVPAKSGKTFANINPADTDDVIGEFQNSDASDVADAVAGKLPEFAHWLDYI